MSTQLRSTEERLKVAQEQQAQAQEAASRAAVEALDASAAAAGEASILHETIQDLQAKQEQEKREVCAVHGVNNNSPWSPSLFTQVYAACSRLFASSHD